MNAQQAVNETQPAKIDVNSLTGEAEQKVNSALGKQYQHCQNKFTIQPEHIYAYGHSDGHELANGDGLWITIQCPKCGYDLSAQHWDTNLF